MPKSTPTMQKAHAPVAAIARLAGALPAVWYRGCGAGVVNTMGSVGQPLGAGRHDRLGAGGARFWGFAGLWLR